MKKLTVIVLVSALILATMASCKLKKTSKFGESNNGLQLYNDLSVEEVVIESFDTKKYDLDEYKGFLEEELAAYNKDNTFKKNEYHTTAQHELTASIAIVTCEVKGNEILQRMIFATAEDYTKYSVDALAERKGTQVVAGDLTQMTAGMGEVSYTDKDGKSISLTDYSGGSKATNYLYIGTDAEALLYGEGTLIGFSKGGVYDKEGDCVKVSGGEMVYAIFKAN